jgi:hypothetical protein
VSKGSGLFLISTLVKDVPKDTVLSSNLQELPENDINMISTLKAQDFLCTQLLSKLIVIGRVCIDNTGLISRCCNKCTSGQVICFAMEMASGNNSGSQRMGDGLKKILKV